MCRCSGSLNIGGGNYTKQLTSKNPFANEDYEEGCSDYFFIFHSLLSSRAEAVFGHFGRVRATELGDKKVRAGVANALKPASVRIQMRVAGGPVIGGHGGDSYPDPLTPLRFEAVVTSEIGSHYINLRLMESKKRNNRFTKY